MPPARRPLSNPSSPATRLQGSALLRRLLKDHVTDDARQMLAERVLDHLEQSGFEIDEGEQVIRKRPPTPRHA